MQIEQFDTGLKGQEKVEKIVISPEENYNYKQVVRKYLNSIVNDGISKLDQNLKNAFSHNINVNCFYPLNEFVGVDDFKEKFWKPLFNSFPDLERREQIVIEMVERINRYKQDQAVEQVKNSVLLINPNETIQIGLPKKKP